MSALETRRREDFSKVKALCGQPGGRIQLISADGEAPSTIKLRLNYKTAGGTNYPQAEITTVELKIQIPAG